MTSASVRSEAAVVRFMGLTPPRALALPLGVSLLLVAFGLLPSARENSRLLWAFVGAGGALLAWTAFLTAVALRGGRTLALEVVLRKQHYLQALAQGSVLLYWGWYWRQVYDSADLIAAQLVFAYAFDMLLGWSRRDTYTLGFGPFPVIFSINLFLWFKPDWFYLQFVLVAAGFAAKEMLRWQKDGRQTHIFNPSSFPLALFSLVLLLTGTSDISWGTAIATTLFNPPQIYVMIFLVGLPGQFFFGVTSMTMSAAVTTYVFGQAYFAATGTYFFFDSYIPIAVFLGMHLLFTDPSTSPRTELGRIVFGVLYGLSVIALYAFQVDARLPTFSDKLLAVPILNLMIRGIDRTARSKALNWLDPAALGRGFAGRQRNLAYMSIWALIFVILSATDGVGDTHPGHRLPFWQQACREGRRNACGNLAVMESVYCSQGSGWACNELGTSVADNAAGSDAARRSFQRSCDLGFLAGCDNLKISAGGTVPPSRLPPRLDDYSIVLLEGKGPLTQLTPLELYEKACTQGWPTGCRSAGLLYLRGEWTSRDVARGGQFLRQACDLGLTAACRELTAEGQP